MGIVQIVLTFFAWKNGWKWKALIPMVSLFIIGFMFGLFGLNINELSLLILILDIIGTIALILMVVNKNKIKE